MKGYGATFGLARDIARRNVDFPAFGKPIYEGKEKILMTVNIRGHAKLSFSAAMQ